MPSLSLHLPSLDMYAILLSRALSLSYCTVSQSYLATLPPGKRHLCKHDIRSVKCYCLGYLGNRNVHCPIAALLLLPSAKVVIVLGQV